MKTRNGKFKYQRQKIEHKRQTGRKLIDEEYNRIMKIVNLHNRHQLNSLFVNNVKTIKRKYNVTNVGKSERCWTQFYNIHK